MHKRFTLSMTILVAKLSQVSVLLVDAHQMLLDLWSSLLSRDERFTVCGQTTSIVDAVDIAKKLRPDIVLLDINTKANDGFETTKLIRQYSPASRIIGVSSFVLPAYAKKMKSLGAMGYVTKTSSLDEIIIAMLDAMKGQFYFCRQILEAIKNEEKIKTTRKNSSSVLTSREIEIITLIKQGLTSKQIADKLHLSPKTINIHRNNIFRKMSVKNVSSLITTAQQMGL